MNGRLSARAFENSIKKSIKNGRAIPCRLPVERFSRISESNCRRRATRFPVGEKSILDRRKNPQMKRRAVIPGTPYILSHILPHVISREIDLCEIALSRGKRDPRVRGVGSGGYKSLQNEVEETSRRNRGIKFGNGGRSKKKKEKRGRKIPPR